MQYYFCWIPIKYTILSWFIPIWTLLLVETWRYKKGPAQADRSPSLYQSDDYSSTAACAAAKLNWLSTSYMVFVNYWRLFYDTFCTFLHAHGNDNVFLRQKNLFLCHIFNVWFYNKLLDSGLTIVNCKCFMYSIEPKPSETLCKLCLQS